jgi:hypothetical protein
VTEQRTCARVGCEKPLPPGSAVQRKYCTGRCQRAAHRALHEHYDTTDTSTEMETGRWRDEG